MLAVVDVAAGVDVAIVLTGVVEADVELVDVAST